MRINNHQSIRIIILLPLILLLTSCAAGDAQFSADQPAGFWYGLWHGIISIISLVLQVFNDNVGVYEINNSGGWYDFGFLLGVIAIWGGGSHASCKSRQQQKRDQEWEEIGEKVELKIMHKLKQWAEDEDNSGSREEWEEIGDKVEKKLKRIIRDWAEKD